MIKQINAALKTYYEKVQRFNSVNLADLKVTAVGWKVADEEEYARCYKQLRTRCDRTVETWMNDRWIAEMHLKDQALDGDITIIKLMQRRPDSDDALGLDHVDFLCNDIKQVEATLQKTENVTWSWESNDVVANYSWISVWFEDTEAKIKQDTVIDIIIKELEEINHDIKR